MIDVDRIESGLLVIGGTARTVPVGPGLRIASAGSGPAMLVAERVYAVLPDRVIADRVRITGFLRDGRLSAGKVVHEADVAEDLDPEARAALIADLWRRGLPGDPAAIEHVRAAHRDPVPEWLRGPEETTLRVALTGDLAAQSARLVADTYWNAGLKPELILGAQTNATGWIGATDPHGRLVATARVLTDRWKWAWVYDVVVEANLRGKGVGEALFRLVLDHPAVRGCLVVRLGTKDADGFYRKFGFVEQARWPRRPWTSIEMALFRGLLPHAVPVDRAAS